jgi:lipopolysaccharide export system protein LptC
MYNRPIILFPLALLTILALLTFWINRSVHPPEHKPDGSSRHDPDYILNNFVTTKTDPNGNILYVLHATEMKHFPDDDSTVLKQPDLVQYATGKPNTRITSKRGLVSSNGENVQFMDDVKLVRDAFADRGEMTLLTEYLDVTPDTGIATTDKPVVIKQAPKTVIHGTGMIYNKKLQTIQLLNSARVHYVRPAVTKKPNVKPSAKTSSKNSIRNKPVNQQRKATRN